MKRNVIIIAIVLLFAHLQLETSELSEKVNYNLLNQPVWPIQSKEFKPKWYIENGMILSWWIKHNSDRVLLIITYFILYVLARKEHKRLGLIAGMFFVYHVLDTLMMWWNWNSYHWFYWILLAMILIGVIIIVWPMKKESAIIKRINDNKPKNINF